MAVAATRWVPRALRRAWTDNPLPLDLAFYLACAGYALIVALTNEFYGFRIWGNFAVAGYGLAAAHSGWLLLRARAGRAATGWWQSRWAGVAAAFVIGMVVPLGVLVVRRLTGVDWLITPWSWSAQPEVWVIERSGDLLLERGTPYVDVTALGRPPEVNDYTPYGPVMSLFGLPRALFGGTPVNDALTDARLMFALVACACVLIALKLLGRPKVPVRAAQLAVVFPMTAYNWATQGPDLAIVGLIIVGIVLAARDRPVAAAILLALVSSAKLTAAIATPVPAMLVLARLGKRGLARFVTAWLAMCALLNVPVLLVDPKSFLEHLLWFPAGMGVVTSPAASPLPGHLIASTGTVGKVASFALLGAAAIAILVWLVRRPPTTASDAMLRTAIGLGAFTLLTPATRYGYLVYPLVLLGAMLGCRSAEAERDEFVTSS
ncbi:glycosyltransferase 87 family protein [Amycolatopsis anabasis]|uniref:glycosyltransferase 87 family protein n=1 Tax=Amycolatopsis anabasis TaxID=1840409 RepID=UPI00131C1190|nr:glycosyltransferase 87 family protein [Amycolatopsis anabasis]